MNAYTPRVDRVIDYIRENLADELTLVRLAKVAHFSPTHFHRIFRAATGETLAAFTRRARLERALYLMRARRSRDLSSIGLEVGFATPSDFSRVFKRVYGIAPSAWDREQRLDNIPDVALEARAGGPPTAPTEPRLVQRPATRLLYLRIRDPWTASNLATGYQQLIESLKAHEIPWRERNLVGMSWDNDKATPMERLTYDLGITVTDTELGAISETSLATRALIATLAVEVHCTSLPQIAQAWDYLYACWLPNSSYEPDDLPAIKYFRITPAALSPAAWNVDCSIALRKAWA